MMKFQIQRSNQTNPPPKGNKPSPFGSSEEDDENHSADGEVEQRQSLPEGLRKLPSRNTGDEGETIVSSCRSAALVAMVNRELEEVNEQQEVKKDAIAEKALREDPSIFDYDSYHDTKTVEEGQQVLERKEIAKKSRYISEMQEAAEKRKIENDICSIARLKKEAQGIEAEANGDLPTERFVTSAYKEHLNKLHEHQTQQAQKDLEDAKKDVHKGDFAKAFMKFRENITTADRFSASAGVLTEAELEQVDQTKEEMTDEYYSNLNLGIKSETRKKDTVQTDSSTVKVKAEYNARSGTPEIEDRKISSKIEDTKSVKHESPPPTAEIPVRTGPSEALRKLQAKEAEPWESKLNRKRQRWERKTDENELALSRKRYLERVQRRLWELER